MELLAIEERSGLVSFEQSSSKAIAEQEFEGAGARVAEDRRRWAMRLMWLGAAIALVLLAHTGVGWDSSVCWRAIQDVRQGKDPYAEGIIVLRTFHFRLALNPAERPPNVYVYSPLTLPLLRFLGALPGWVLGLVYGASVATGALAQLWAGFQMADKYERRWLPLLLPAILFFPGLVTDDAILSGNVAFVLYGVILAAAVFGWKRGSWSWYYIAVLVASIFKLPFLTLLAFPVLMDWRQWFRSSITATGGVLIFAAEMWLWPEMIREYLLTLRLMFDWEHDFGFGPVGVLAKALVSRGLASSPVVGILYVAFAGVLGIALLFLARRVRELNMQETWVPVALVGTVLLNPRIMKYDLAAISIPMLLIGWRTLRYALERSNNRPFADVPYGTAHNRFLRMPIFVIAGLFLIPNVMTVAGPSWFPAELLVLLAVFAGGVLMLLRKAGAEWPAWSESYAADSFVSGTEMPAFDPVFDPVSDQMERTEIRV